MKPILEQEWEEGEEGTVWVKGGGRDSFVADTVRPEYARVIAAAPDMVRALMDVAMPLGDGDRCWCASVAAHHVSPSRACDAARAALRKAGVL